MRARKRVVFSGFLLLTAVVAGLAVHRAQRADYGWWPRPLDAGPAQSRAVVAFDVAHHEGSSARWYGRYYPLARLLRAAGYRTRIEASAPFRASALRDVDVLVLANASGAAKPQFLGINLPVGRGGDRASPAFDGDEIAVLLAWVRGGGGLLLVADHAPFGAANAGLATAFGVTLHGGFTEVPGESSDPLRFDRARGRLGTHPVLAGVDCVQTFTGESLTGPPGAEALLRLPANAVESVDDGSGSFRAQAAGPLQGLAMEVGRGRVVVLGEAAMLTAQVDGGRPFGLQMPGCGNQRFAEQLFAWLAASGGAAR